MTPDEGATTSRRDTGRCEPPLLVGVAASEGAVPALVELFSSMTDTSSFAFVVVGDARGSSGADLADELAGKVAERVCPVVDRVKLEPACIYVAPRGSCVIVKKQRLRLVDGSVDPWGDPDRRLSSIAGGCSRGGSGGRRAVRLPQCRSIGPGRDR